MDVFVKYLSAKKGGRGVTPPQSYPTGGFYLNNDDICRHSPSLSFYFNDKKNSNPRTNKFFWLGNNEPMVYTEIIQLKVGK